MIDKHRPGSRDDLRAEREGEKDTTTRDSAGLQVGSVSRRYYGASDEATHSP